MSIENVYNFTVQRQNSADMPPGKSPSVKIKFIKDESLPSHSLKFKIGNDNTQTDAKCSSSSFVEEIKSEYKKEELVTLPVNQTHSSVNLIWNLLLHLYGVIEKKDTSGIFANPVNEDHAPNYSSIISKPMDLSTIRSKIENHFYKNVANMLDDVILMLQNAVVYNNSGTVYHRIASQMLNFVKKTFSRDNLNKLIQSKLWSSKPLTEEESGSIEDCLERIKVILLEKPKNRPIRVVHRNPHVENFTKKRRASNENPPNVSTRRRSAQNSDTGIKEIPESEIDGSCSYKNLQSETSSISNESDSDDCEEILFSAQQAAKKAKEQLKQRPVVYFDKRGDDICVVNTNTGVYVKVGEELNNMVKRINSVNLQQMIGNNEACLSRVHQLCYDSNECVTLTTSKPLEPYSCAEQAVLVETFGNVTTAEYACNMHNYVLDLPANSAAEELVKSRLNAATNYLTYGVDQIITKKLRAANKWQ